MDDPVPEGQDVDEIVIGKFCEKKFSWERVSKKGREEILLVRSLMVILCSYFGFPLRRRKYLSNRDRSRLIPGC